MKNIITLISCVILGLLLISMTNFFCLLFDIEKVMIWNEFVNPFMIICAISLLNLARQKVFVNNVINYLSSLSLLIFIFHFNNLTMDYLKVRLFDYIYFHYTYKAELLWIVLNGIFMLVYAILISIVYKYTIQKITQKECVKLYKLLKPPYILFKQKILDLK